MMRDFLGKCGQPQSLCANNLAGIRGQLAADDFQQRSLARTISPYQTDPFTSLDLQVHPVNEFRSAECNLHVLQAY
jgi:hypothetical protein